MVQYAPFFTRKKTMSPETNEYREQRMQFLEKLREMGYEPY